MSYTFKYLILLTINFIVVAVGLSQTPTVGLIYSDIDVSDGYTLFTPETNTNVYLINNCGEKVNEWIFSERPSLTCYLLENGNILRVGVDSLQIRDWDNNLVWSYSLTDANLNQHHDIEPLPNGNILLLIRDKYTDAEIIAEGRNPLSLNGNFRIDKVVEIQPIGNNDANIVWEWKLFDHFIQDFDNSKSNFGVVVDNPELIDLNFNANDDYTHINSIDYNANLDQILLSARHLNEIYIIDHSTTTSEASSHSGGNSNMGGDILWRWGNPQVYDVGDSTDQKLFLQHDSKWVDSGFVDEGKISVFNNHGDGTETFSSVHLIYPTISNNVYTKTNGEFNPLDYDWSWQGSLLGIPVNEFKKSSAQSLSNGNVLICETGLGRISEISKTGTHLWSYINPIGSTLFNQQETPINVNLFKAEKYPIDFMGFVGKDLSPIGIIENENFVSESCSLTVSIEKFQSNSLIAANPVKNDVLLFNNEVDINKIVIMDTSGKIVYNKTHFKGSSLNIHLPPTLYFIQLDYEGKRVYQKIIIQ